MAIAFATHSTAFFAGVLIGLLALLTIGRRLGWLYTCTVMLAWCLAADSEAEALSRLWGTMTGRTPDVGPLPDSAWTMRGGSWAALVVQSLVAAAFMGLYLKDRWREA